MLIACVHIMFVFSKTNYMWTTEVSRTTTATKEQIWKLWTDVPNWNIWDKDLETSEIFGDFKKGAKGVLKPVNGPKTKFTMTECEPLKSFTDRTFLPLCKMDFVHIMTETPDGLEITHKVVMTGFMTFIFSKLVGKNIEKGLPEAVEKLIDIAEKR